MVPVEQSMREIHGIRPNAIPPDVLTSTRPLLLRGLVADWPIVQAARDGAGALDRYIRAFYKDATVGLLLAPPEAAGRIFYNEDMTGFNFERLKLKLDQVLDGIMKHLGDARPPMFYVGSTTVDTCLPGLREENDVELGEIAPLVSLWLGNRTRVAAHFDALDNLACCAAGRRRFTLFPPDQLENLYVGPLDFTPAGQAISLVDFADPDLQRFPRFSEALRHAEYAELEPGDAVFIPSMWWHHVEGLDGFNLLINYWWSRSPAYMGDPKNVLNHALLSLRGLPAAQRKAWQELFRHYVFEFDEESFSHIPARRRGILGTIDETMGRQIRAHLLNRLNR